MPCELGYAGSALLVPLFSLLLAAHLALRALALLHARMARAVLRAPPGAPAWGHSAANGLG